MLSKSLTTRTISILLLVVLFWLCLVCTLGGSDEETESRTWWWWKESSRWHILSKSTGSLVENGLLLLMSGSPVSSVRSAIEELRECVGKSYDEEVGGCIVGPARSVAANLMVLTDWRTWVMPPEPEYADDVIVDVVSRRLKPDVRDDQCNKSEKPAGEEE